MGDACGKEGKGFPNKAGVGKYKLFSNDVLETAPMAGGRTPENKGNDEDGEGKFTHVEKNEEWY